MAWGKGNGKGQGAWVFLPAGGKGKGKGWGVTNQFAAVKPNSDKKFIEKLAKIDNSLKVWVGGLGKSFAWKKLEKAVEEQVSKPTLTHVYTNGKACIAMPTVDDVANVVASLNGTELAGKTLEVDVWVKGEFEKKEKTQGEKKVKKVKKQTKSTSKQLTKMDEKMKEKLKACDPSLKVWVGGLAADVDWKKLKDHFTTAYAKPDLVEIMRKGSAVVTYATAEEVASAVSSVNGTEIEGQTVEVDLWVKPEREKKEKK